MKHFFIKARVLEQMGTEADFDLVDRAWSEAGKWAPEVANFRHPKIASIRLAGDPNGPVLPQDMMLDELRDSITADIERLRKTGVLDLPRLPQGVVCKLMQRDRKARQPPNSPHSPSSIDTAPAHQRSRGWVTF